MISFNYKQEGEYYNAENGECSLTGERCGRKGKLEGACGVCPISAAYLRRRERLISTAKIIAEGEELSNRLYNH
ncbi:MAG: hypothetical protein ACP5D2_03075 [Candidatus Nanoarchaeia archaeon]